MNETIPDSVVIIVVIVVLVAGGAAVYQVGFEEGYWQSRQEICEIREPWRPHRHERLSRANKRHLRDYSQLWYEREKERHEAWKTVQYWSPLRDLR